VAIRTCPLCMTRIPAGDAAAYTGGLECPGCKGRLEVSVGSRILATTLGLAAGAMAWSFSWGSGGALDWLLPILYAYLAFSVVSALYLMFTADLRSKPAEPMAVRTPIASHGPGVAHH